MLTLHRLLLALQPSPPLTAHDESQNLHVNGAWLCSRAALLSNTMPAENVAGRLQYTISLAPVSGFYTQPSCPAAGYQNATQTASVLFTADLSQGAIQFFLPLPDFLGLTSVVFHTALSMDDSPQQQLVIDNMVIGVA